MVKWKLHEKNLTSDYSLSDEILKNKFDNIILFFLPSTHVVTVLSYSIVTIFVSNIGRNTNIKIAVKRNSTVVIAIVAGGGRENLKLRN